MKVFLMYRDHDFDPEAVLPANAADLIQDLDLDILLHAMAGEDHFMYDVVKTGLLVGLDDEGSVLYRQQILRDCLEHQDLAREFYSVATEAIENKRRHWFSIFTTHPGSILYSAVQLIGMFIPLLERLRGVAERGSVGFASEGFRRLCSMLQEELSEDYLNLLRTHLKYLTSQDVLISARLGTGAEAIDHVLRKPKDFGRNWFSRIFKAKVPSFSFSVNPRDDAGCRALGELKDRGINFAANALARSADHIESFFALLRSEIAFYVGCLNLNDALTGLGEPVCFPTPHPAGTLGVEFTGLYNACLSIHAGKRSVGNNADAVGKNPVIITGVNEGGKSTFLRSIGLAQLMMQCGMFVPATSYSSDMASGVFTHYRRREDRGMLSGKFDEELSRMDVIADRMAPYGLIIFNESFAATNEREGSDIAAQITRALVGQGIRVFFVTHLYAFAHSLIEDQNLNPLFLRAERNPDGSRTFRIVPGRPAQKSHGEDLYRRIFVEEEPTPVVPIHEEEPVSAVGEPR